MPHYLEQNCYLPYITSEDCDQLIQFSKETCIKIKEWSKVAIEKLKKYLIKNSFHISLPILPILIPGIVKAGVFLDITLTHEKGDWKLTMFIKSSCNINIFSLIDFNVEAGVGVNINLSHVFEIIKQFFASTPLEIVPRTDPICEPFAQTSANASIFSEAVFSIIARISLVKPIKKAWKYFTKSIRDFKESITESITVNNLSRTFGVVHYY